MESHDIERIKHIVNTEAIRRLLTKYFVEKGFETFDERVYPSLIYDMPYVLPVLGSKVEVVPYASDIDNALGKATLGWNLFVLGTFRMSLGETIHRDLLDLSRQIKSGIYTVPSNPMSSCRKAVTPKQIINFIVRVLSSHERGYVDLIPSSRGLRIPGEVNQNRNGSSTGQYQQFYSRGGG